MSGERFIYLDGDQEREQLVKQIGDVRLTLLERVAQMPEQHHYVPRYGERSVAMMLAHLLVFDTAALWFVRAASNGYALKPSRKFVRRADHMLTRFFRNRLVNSTVEGLNRKEAEIAAFIRTVPIDKLSMDVYHPGRREPYTVEQALQIYFVQHWQRQLLIIEQVDGVVGKP